MKTLSLYSKLLSLSSPAEIKSELIRTKRNRQPYGIILGVAGRGRGIHPWDNLKKCPKCGDYPWFVGNDGKDFQSGSPYRIICSNHNCDCQSIESSSTELCIEDWNGN